MKLGIAVSTFPTKFGPIVLTGDNLEENLTIASELGYQGIDLFMNQKTDDEIDRIAHLLDSLKLRISMYSAIFLAERGVNFSDKDEAKRHEGVAAFKKQIDIAHRLNAVTMPVGFIRGNRLEGESQREYLGRLAESMCELCEYAGTRGIDICLEPINRYEMSSILRVEEVLEFIEGYHIKGLKVLPDFFHMNIEEVSIEKALLMAGDKIGHIHVTDSNRLAPGQGHLDYDVLLGTLKQVGYQGYISVEAFPKPSAYECAKQGAEYLTAVLGRM
jgi:sugar phosphate isomerase/epimerase